MHWQCHPVQSTHTKHAILSALYCPPNGISAICKIYADDSDDDYSKRNNRAAQFTNTAFLPQASGIYEAGAHLSIHFNHLSHKCDFQI